VRYKQTAIGAAWAVIQPFFTMVVFSVFFGSLARMPSDGIPYPIFAYSALVPWTCFANALFQASNSVVQHEHVITEIYFPRLVPPLASVLGGLVHFAIALAVLLGMMLFYRIVPTAAVWTLPFFTLLAVTAALRVALWLSALNAQYRDVRDAIPFLIQFWLFATPIADPSSLVPQRWRALYGLKRTGGVVEGFRWALLGQAQAPGPLLAVSAAMLAILLLSGLYYFRRMEKTFADVV
jgi:lipopolysaccharide transport system permease protein